MKAIVGFSFPEKQSALLLWRPVCVTSESMHLTCKHLAEVAGVHLHDHVGFDLRLTLPDAAGPALQVQEPNTCVFTLHTKTHTMNIPTGSPHRATSSGLKVDQMKQSRAQTYTEPMILVLPERLN